jgi:hypothetical protein
MKRVQIDRMHFPPDSDGITLATGIVLATSQHIRLVVPPEAVLGVLAAVHHGNKPVLEIHDFDVVDWSAFWEED